jgi:hypothetical protein
MHKYTCAQTKHAHARVAWTARFSDIVFGNQKKVIINLIQDMNLLKFDNIHQFPLTYTDTQRHTNARSCEHVGHTHTYIHAPAA